jgi:hypothetical protein
MSNVVVTLGGVSFQDFEVPEKISFGGTQRLAVQELIGGGRVVDALGEDDGEIAFAGIFAGGDAAQRAQTLDTARAAGAVLALFWDQYFYNVVIAEFAADYRKPWWIPFALRCVVASDPLLDAGTDTPASYLVSNDLAVVTSLLGQAGISLVGLSHPTQAGLAAAQSVITSGIASTGAALNTQAGALSSATDAASGIAAMNQLTAASGALAALSGMSGYVGRATSNLASELV